MKLTVSSVLLLKLLSLAVKEFISKFDTKFVSKFDVMREKVKSMGKEAAKAKASRMFNCSIYSFTLSLGLKVLTQRPDIKGGAVDSKIKRVDLFPAFTKACERFRKLNKVTRSYVTFWGAQGEKPRQTYVKESFQKDVIS